MQKSNSKTSTKQQKTGQKSNNQWNQCTKCELIIQKSSNEDHNCSQIDTLIETNKTFLFKNLTYLSTIEHSKELIKDVQIGKEYLFDFAFINPVTMRLADFKLGDLIVIKDLNTNINMVAICWSSPQIDLSQISFNKNYLNLNNIQLDQSVICYKLKDKPKLASEIKLDYSLSSLDLEKDNDLFIAYLKEIYFGKFLQTNQPLSIVYLGQRLIFKVLNITSNQSTQHLNGKHNNLSTSFESILSLNDRPVSFNETNIKATNLADKFAKQLQINWEIIDEIFQVNAKTQFSISTPIVENDNLNETKEQIIKFNDIAGLNKEIELLKEFFIQPFEFSGLYKQIGVEFSKGILLFGPSGCGKTVLAKALCNELKCGYSELKITDIYSKNYGETESKLKEFFRQAMQRAPCVVFIDEIDSLCSRKETLNQESEKRILSLFITLLDQSKNVLFLCLTNKIDNIDLTLRRPGRLDKEIEIPIPNQSTRYSILKKKLESLDHNLNDDEILEVAQNCHGYVGADLELLVKESGLICIKRLMNQPNNVTKVTKQDLFESLKKIKPSAMREISFDIPKVYWNQIGGQHELKKKLQQAIIWPIKYADSFKRLNIKAPRGLLMYGPPGCSKTMIAKALATETGLNFIAVKGPELFSKWVGESERTVREIFRKARNASPAIIFFDEIDAVATERSNSSSKGNNNVGDRVLAQLLNEMDGVENLNDVTIVAATNRPDMIDKALMRPGRLDRIVYVTLPDESTRKEIFELKFKQIPIADDVDLDYLIANTERYSGAEIAAVCNEAAFLALETDLSSTKINMDNFKKALILVTPRTSDETIKYFDSFSFNSGLHEI